MQTSEFDAAIIGGGIVGLATAWQLLCARPSLSVVVVEAERQLAAHQTGNNSGVIHAGVYYKPGSLKARLCRSGRDELMAFAADHAIPYRIDGKLIVAVADGELDQLDELHRRARENGLRDVALIATDELRKIEPNATGTRALHVPESGVIDYGAVARALARSATERGADVRVGWRVDGLERNADGWSLSTAEADQVRASAVITCAGLGTDRLRRLAGTLDGAYRIFPFRGSYRDLGGSSEQLVRSMIYPVPDPRYPFLGVHFTRGIDGHVHVGPNALLDLPPRRLRAALRYPGLRAVLIGNALIGVGELWRHLVDRAYVRNAQRYLPALRGEDLSPGGSGVRAQCIARDGSMADDFLVTEHDRLLHVLNAPSPAATASLAIGRELATRTLTALG